MELVFVETLGDRNKDFSLFERLDSTKETGFFVREVERLLLCGGAELAVHSLKDLPCKDTEGLVVKSFGQREDAQDLFISKRFASLKDAEQSKHARVGTSSLRRKALLLHYYPNLQWCPLRGNVESRVKRVLKVDGTDEGKNFLGSSFLGSSLKGKEEKEAKKEGSAEKLDGIILARAGVKRLGLETKSWEKLSLSEWLPAPGQGVLALQTQKNNAFIQGLMEDLCDPITEEETRAERLVLEHLQGGCQAPIGVYAKHTGGTLKLSAFVGSSDGKIFLKEAVEGKNPETLALQISQALIEKGAEKILQAERNKL